MVNSLNRSKVLAIAAFGLPVGVFAAYLTYQIVPEIVRIVVPAVVVSVLNS